MDLTTRAGRKQQGSRIQRAAEEAGISLEELARAIGCSRALVYQYVSGLVLAQTTRLQKIAERTGRPLTYFFEAEPEPATPEAGGEAPTGAAAASPALPAEGQSGPAPHSASLAPDDLQPRDRSAAALPVRSTWNEPAPDHTFSDPGASDFGTADRVPADRGPSDRAAPPAPPLAPVRPAASGADSNELARVSLYYLEQLAALLEAHGGRQELLSVCEQILPYARQLQDRPGEARAWLRIGNARIQMGHMDLALEALTLALRLAEALGQAALALACRQSLGRAALSSGDTDRALHEFRLVAASADWHQQWQGAISQAAVYEHRGDLQAAMTCCAEAMEVVDRAAGIRRGDIETARLYVMSNQANVYLACGDFAGASRLSEELLLSAEREQQREQFVEALINLGICRLYDGRWDEAETNLLRAVDLSRFTGDTPLWGFARAWRAALLCSVGDLESAKEEAKDALRIGLETASRRCEIQAHLSLGEAYLRSGAHREALYHFRQAHQAAVASATAAAAVLALERCAAARLRLGETAAAARELDAALQQAESLGIQHGEAMGLVQRCRLLAAAGDPGQAVLAASAAAAAAAHLGLAELQWQAEAALASVLDQLDRPEEAARHGDVAIAVLEDLRQRVRSRRGEECLLEDADRLAAYEQQLRRLQQLGRTADAAALADHAQWLPLQDLLPPAKEPRKRGARHA